MSVERVHCPRITSPCTQKLEFTRGQRTAFCGLCQKNVHNISAMSAPERAQLWARKQTPCVRYVRLIPAAVVVLSSVGVSASGAAESEISEEPMEWVEVGGVSGAPTEEIFLVSEDVEEHWLDDKPTQETP